MNGITIIDIEILDILPYISSYFITPELYINNNHNNNNNNNNDFNNNISKYYRKIRKNHMFCFNNFWGVTAAQGVIYHPRVRKAVIKLQQIISKH